MAMDAMVETLTKKVINAVDDQTRFAFEFKYQLEDMKIKLEFMTGLLSYADQHKDQRERIKKVLPILRKLIYDADDILTDCQIRDEYRKDGFFYSLSLCDLFFKNQTGKELSRINKRIKEIESSLGMFGQFHAPKNQQQFSRYSSQSYDPSEIIGLEDDMEKIKLWIFRSNEELQRIGIVGMGGLGKTTIAQKVFNDGNVVTRFDHMIWVPVSQNYNEEQIMRVMLKQLGEDDSRLEQSHLLRKIHQILSDKACLIVMDDVWTMNLDWWNKICPYGKNCYVIITSRNEDVTKNMGVDESRIHRPRTLNEEESWLLFCKHAFFASRGKCPKKEFEGKGREILKKCGGLPLAIKTIGALLAAKVHSLNEWEKIHDYFHELTTEGQHSSVVASLQLSYDELPSLLKQCLLCFSIYPEDFEVSGEQIVHWWVGEGLIPRQETKTATELGFEYLSELVNRCLIEVVNRRGYDGRVYSCKMHDLVRDMTIKIAKDEGFCSFNEQGKLKLMEDSRWFGFTSNTDQKSLKKCSRLRALLLISSIPKSPERNAEVLLSLRVLDFSYSKLDAINLDDLFIWICSLKRLAHLNLSRIAGLKKVPRSIQRLRNLQILILRKCNNLAKLNRSITNLRNLIILDLGLCALRHLPHELGKLIHLQELSGFKVVGQANTQSCRLLHLLNLEQLRVLRMSVNDESEISENERNALSQLKKLKVLDIDAENAKQSRVSEMVNQLLPPSSLQELYLRRYRHEILPNWINPEHLSNLKYLCLEDGDIISFRMSSESENTNGSTWILEGICLNFVQKLVLDWNNFVKDMPFLRYAEVSGCFNLKSFPYPSDKPVVWRKDQD